MFELWRPQINHDSIVRNRLKFQRRNLSIDFRRFVAVMSDIVLTAIYKTE